MGMCICKQRAEKLLRKKSFDFIGQAQAVLGQNLEGVVLLWNEAML